MSTRASRHKFDLALKPTHSPFQKGATLLLIHKVARDSELAMRLVFIWAQICARTRNPVKAMKEENLDNETILKTNIGWIYFWSDSFMQCFINQKGNSVWILTVTI